MIIKYRVFLCSAGKGFNFSASRPIGYTWQYDYIKGRLPTQPENITWTGNASNSVEEVFQSLYPKLNANITFYEQTNEYLDEIFLLPFGWCLEVKDISNILYVGTRDPMKVYLTDPFRQSYYRLEKNAMRGDPVPLSNKKKDLYEALYYEVDVVIENKRKDKTTCRDYEKPNDFADCVHTAMKKKMKEMLNCIPLWLFGKQPYSDNEICSSNLTFSTEEQRDSVIKFIGNVAEQIYFVNKESRTLIQAMVKQQKIAKRNFVNTKLLTF